MTVYDDKDYAQYRLRKAEETYDLVDMLVQNGMLEFAVNRLYYAAFYAISTLLSIPKLNPEIHSKVRNNFSLKYLTTKKIDARLGNTYSELYDFKSKEDFAEPRDVRDFTKEEVLSLAKRTRELLDAVLEEIRKKDAP